MTYCESQKHEDFLKLDLNGVKQKFSYSSLRAEGNFEAICGALSHESIDIAVGASIVLGHLQDERALPYLLQALLTTGGRKAQAVSWALGELGHESALPFLTEALSSNFIPKSAIVALGKIGAPASIGILERWLFVGDEITRALAARALGQLKFDGNRKLIERTHAALKKQLKVECARSVKLVICAYALRLERLLGEKPPESSDGL